VPDVSVTQTTLTNSATNPTHDATMEKCFGKTVANMYTPAEKNIAENAMTCHEGVTVENPSRSKNKARTAGSMTPSQERNARAPETRLGAMTPPTRLLTRAAKDMRSLFDEFVLTPIGNLTLELGRGEAVRLE
jgi:hypothetical protein